NNIWELVDLPARRKAIGSKWVFKIKYKSDREIERYEARLVAKWNAKLTFALIESGFVQSKVITVSSLSLMVISLFFSPLKSHLKTALKVIRYLKSSPGKGINVIKQSASGIASKAYSNADWTKCTNTRRSITSYCLFMCGSLISWKSKKQNTISKSSTEAEYRAFAFVTSEVVWVLKILKDLNCNKLLPVNLYIMFHNYRWLADLYMLKRRHRSGMYQLSAFREKDKKDGSCNGGIGAKAVEKGVRRPTKIDTRRDARSYREVLNSVKSFEEGSVNVQVEEDRHTLFVVKGNHHKDISSKVDNKVPSTLHEDEDQDCNNSKKSCEFEGFGDEGEEVEKTQGYNPHDKKDLEAEESRNTDSVYRKGGGEKLEEEGVNLRNKNTRRRTSVVKGKKVINKSSSTTPGGKLSMKIIMDRAKFKGKKKVAVEASVDHKRLTTELVLGLNLFWIVSLVSEQTILGSSLMENSNNQVRSSMGEHVVARMMDGKDFSNSSILKSKFNQCKVSLRNLSSIISMQLTQLRAENLKTNDIISIKTDVENDKDSKKFKLKDIEEHMDELAQVKNGLLQNLVEVFVEATNNQIMETTRNLGGNARGMLWNKGTEIHYRRKVSSMFHELKNNRTKSYELPDVVGHFIELGKVYYGGGFIHQKLETLIVKQRKVMYFKVLPIALRKPYKQYDVISNFAEHIVYKSLEELNESNFVKTFPTNGSPEKFQTLIKEMFVSTYGIVSVQPMEADESLDKIKVLEYKNERLLRAVVSQDIMSIMQNNYVEDTSNLQTELERMAFEQHSSKPKLQGMASGHFSSGATLHLMAYVHISA
ncbi:ribonuclease H-like domain-containing protein, partial [Tanacetum coccineum]